MSKPVFVTDPAMTPVITLRQRIADALTKPTSAAEVRSCIAHAQADISRIERDRKQAEARAVDPLATEEEATEAKRLHEALRFDLDRLDGSLARLDARLTEATCDEDQAERRGQYDAAVRACDEAEGLLRNTYPKAVAEIVHVLRIVGEAQALAVAANRRPPAGAGHITDPEVKANGGALTNGSHGVYPIADEVRLSARFGSAQWPVR